MSPGEPRGSVKFKPTNVPAIANRVAPKVTGHEPGHHAFIERAVSHTVEADHALVIAAACSKPKAWGALAAHGVVRFRELTGRAPTDEERRAIWAGLWREVEKAR
jgi:hypothetical protein